MRGKKAMMIGRSFKEMVTFPQQFHMAKLNTVGQVMYWRWQ